MRYHNGKREVINGTYLLSIDGFLGHGAVTLQKVGDR